MEETLPLQVVVESCEGISKYVNMILAIYTLLSNKTLNSPTKASEGTYPFLKEEEDL